MSLFLIGLIAFLALAGFGYGEHERANAAVEHNKTCTAANAALDADAKKKIGDLTKLLQTNAAADQKRAAQTAATLAARKKAALAQQAALDKDVAASKDVTVMTPEVECAAMRKTVGDYARDALGGNAR